MMLKSWTHKEWHERNNVKLAECIDCKKQFMDNVEKFKKMGLNPIQAISNAQAIHDYEKVKL